MNFLIIFLIICVKNFNIINLIIYINFLISFYLLMDYIIRIF